MERHLSHEETTCVWPGGEWGGEWGEDGESTLHSPPAPDVQLKKSRSSGSLQRCLAPTSIGLPISIVVVESKVVEGVRDRSALVRFG